MTVLAESVSLDGRAIAFVLGLIALFLVGIVLVIVGGFVQARRSGRGETMAPWLGILVLEGLGLAVSWRYPLTLLLLGGAIAGQVAVHLRAKRESGR